MKPLWRIPDFLDLEYFFIQDKQLEEKEGLSALRDRDRIFYLNDIAPEFEATEANREWLIFRWLQEQRNRENRAQNGQALLPGRMWYELYGLFWSVFSFMAMATGAGLSYSFLTYTGKQPVNVSLFFLVFVGFQFLILLSLFCAAIIRKMQGLDLRSSLLLSFVNKGLNSFLFRLRKYGLDKMGGIRRSQFAAALAAVRARGKGYGPLFFWPLFLLFQLFGIAFNFGVLGALLVKVASSDLAFGWQSTIQVSSEFVYRMVQWLAFPWSWLLGSTSYPGLKQIEGSRMILKDGFYHLASEDLVSWWPFLGLAICCYCLLPRIILFVAGSFERNRTLSRISFNRADHNQLLHRLLTPRLETSLRKKVLGEPAEKANDLKPEKSVTNRDEVSAETISEKRTVAVNGELLALIPDELFDDCDFSELEQFCSQAFGYRIGGTIRMDGEYIDNRALIDHFSHDDESTCKPLLILQEAWQPPIQEILRFLQELRVHCDNETHIIVALIGKPKPDTLFTPVTDNDLKIWQQKMATLADPCLQLSPLVTTL